jgi:GTPase SAR1 family protein
MLYRIAIATDAGIEVWSYNEVGSPYSLLEPQLISGFMTAIQNFSESVIKSSVNEIRFADLLVYIRTYGKFSLYLFLKDKLDIHLVEEYLSQIAVQVFDLLENQDLGEFPENSVFEERILPLLTPLSQKESKKNLEDSLKEIKKPTIKIAVVGLAKAGKTSMFNIFFKKSSPENIQEIKPTINMVQSIDFEEFLNENILIMDFGGQEVYRRHYLNNITYWKNLTSLIFVIDLQAPISFLPALDYLNQIWKIVCQENSTKPNLSIFFHKYDPERRLELNNNIKTALSEFREYLNTATFFLTSIKDSSSNIALIQTIYFSMPVVMLQKLLDDELLDYFELNILPQFTLESTQSTLLDQIIPLLPSFQQVAVAFGIEYAVTLQKTWLSVLKGNWKPKTRKLTAKSFIIKRKPQSIELTLENWTNEGFPTELTNTLLTGFLEGILRTFEISAPAIIREEGRYTTWEISF